MNPVWVPVPAAQFADAALGGVLESMSRDDLVRAVTDGVIFYVKG